MFTLTLIGFGILIITTIAILTFFLYDEVKTLNAILEKINGLGICGVDSTTNLKSQNKISKTKVSKKTSDK